MIIVKTGDVIPLDGFVVQGCADVDESSVTGQSVPQEKYNGSNVMAGTSVLKGTLVVSKLYILLCLFKGNQK